MSVITYLSPKLALWNGNPAHWCPGCEQLHRFYVNWPNPVNNARWTWNADLLQPTFQPSMLISSENADKKFVCHYFLQNGMLDYLVDTTHKYRSHKIELPDIPPKWSAYSNKP